MDYRCLLPAANNKQANKLKKQIKKQSYGNSTIFGTESVLFLLR